jgi:formate hydrogenlyase subunit 6/NADH:ubiquinone oxidoreductase subunit I
VLNIGENKCVVCGSCVDECVKRCITIVDSVADINEKLLVAVGTDDGKNIKADNHFGMSKYFFKYGSIQMAKRL